MSRDCIAGDWTANGTQVTSQGTGYSGVWQSGAWQPMTRYADLAKTEIANFVRRSTRFNLEDLRFADEECLEVLVNVEVLHQLSCSVSNSTVSGRPSPSADDRLAQSSAEYGALSESLRAEAYGQPDVVRNLAAKVTNGRYGQYCDDTSFGSYPGRVSFTYACPTCSGSGNITCNSCAGQGQNTCGFCCGSGSTWETKSEIDSHGNNTTTTESDFCRSCGGGGYQRCSDCGGDGENSCGACNGHGEMTDISTAAFVVRSGYTLAALSVADPNVDYALKWHADLPRIGESLAKMGNRTIEASENLRQVAESVDFTISFFRADVTVDTAKARMVVFGDKCFVSDAGCLVETLVKPDLQQLQEAVAEVRWFDVRAMRYAQKIGRQFMESEVHQLAIEKAPEHGANPDDYHDLSNSLAKSLSPAYLCQAVGSMERLAKLINLETKLVIGVTAALMAIAFGAYLIFLDEYFMAALLVFGAWVAASAISKFLIALQLRWIGAERFQQFSARRKADSLCRLDITKLLCT